MNEAMVKEPECRARAVCENAQKTEETAQVTVEIRNGQLDDISRIWSIMHSESMSWDDEQIRSKLSEIYVLSVSSIIVAVMCASFNEKRLYVQWTAVHPMYPKAAVTAALRLAVSGAVLRRVELN